jgi:hypothetical protein
MHSKKTSFSLVVLGFVTIQPNSAAFAATPEEMMAHCRERAHKELKIRLPDIETKYEGQRTDGTHAVNGTASSNGRVQTFQCSFGKKGNKIRQFVVNKPQGNSSQSAVSKPESDCLAAVANEVKNGDVSTISVKRGENQIKVEVRVPGAEAPWICEHDSTKVTNVYYGAEG